MRTKMGLAALALLAVGCSQNENVNTPDNQVNAKEIRVGQSVQGLTRGVVTDASDVAATVLMCDGESANWDGFVGVKSNTISSEGVLSVRANTGIASFKAGTSTAVTLNPKLYYENTDKSKKSFLVAVAPTGTLGDMGTVVTMKDVDGQQDVMYADAVDAGSENSVASTITLSFKHLTTQLNFDVKMTEATGAGDWDGKTVTVKNITVQSAQLPQSVDAANGTVTWSTASPLTVPDINNPVLTSSVARVGNPIMLKGESMVKLNVLLKVGESDIQFSNISIKDELSDLTTVTGYSHLITLNVMEPKKAEGAAIIDVKATVAPWKQGTAGSADL